MGGMCRCKNNTSNEFRIYFYIGKYQLKSVMRGKCPLIKSNSMCASVHTLPQFLRMRALRLLMDPSAYLYSLNYPSCRVKVRFTFLYRVYERNWNTCISLDLTRWNSRAMVNQAKFKPSIHVP